VHAVRPCRPRSRDSGCRIGRRIEAGTFLGRIPKRRIRSPRRGNFSSWRNIDSRDKELSCNTQCGGQTMIVPSIDIMNGRAVQLRGGKQPPLDAGNPLDLAERYSRIGEFAVVDLDAAMGKGTNRELILSLCKNTACASVEASVRRNSPSNTSTPVPASSCSALQPPRNSLRGCRASASSRPSTAATRHSWSRGGQNPAKARWRTRSAPLHPMWQGSWSPSSKPRVTSVASILRGPEPSSRGAR